MLRITFLQSHMTSKNEKIDQHDCSRVSCYCLRGVVDVHKRVRVRFFQIFSYNLSYIMLLQYLISHRCDLAQSPIFSYVSSLDICIHT